VQINQLESLGFTATLTDNRMVLSLFTPAQFWLEKANDKTTKFPSNSGSVAKSERFFEGAAG